MSEDFSDFQSQILNQEKDERQRTVEQAISEFGNSEVDVQGAIVSATSKNSFDYVIKKILSGDEKTWQGAQLRATANQRSEFEKDKQTIVKQEINEMSDPAWTAVGDEHVEEHVWLLGCLDRRDSCEPRFNNLSYEVDYDFVRFQIRTIEEKWKTALLSGMKVTPANCPVYLSKARYISSFKEFVQQIKLIDDFTELKVNEVNVSRAAISFALFDECNSFYKTFTLKAIRNALRIQKRIIREWKPTGFRLYDSDDEDSDIDAEFRVSNHVAVRDMKRKCAENRITTRNYFNAKQVYFELKEVYNIIREAVIAADLLVRAVVEKGVPMNEIL